MCERVIPWRSVQFGDPYPCPYCNELTRVSRTYHKHTGFFSLTVAALLCLGLGIRGFWLIPAAAAAFPVVGFVLGFFYRRFWPPPLEYVPERERFT